MVLMAEPVLAPDPAGKMDDAGQLAANKSLKKKKSLPRLFILSREKSAKSRPAPPSASSSEAEPMLVDPTNPPSSAAISGRRRGPGAANVLSRYDSAFSMASSAGSSNHLRSGDSRRTGGSGISPHSRSPLASNPYTAGVLPDRSQDRRVVSAAPASVTLPRAQRPDSKLPTHVNTFPAGTRPHTATSATLFSQETNPKNNGLGSARPAGSKNSPLQRSPIPEQWHAWQSPDAMRDSIRSGLSTGSSTLDSRSTEHSSVFTKASLVSDNTIDFDDAESCKDEMSVADAIDMYAAGFESDDETDAQRSKELPEAEDDPAKRESQLAEAMNDILNHTILIPRPPLMDTTSTDDIFFNMFPHPPPLRRPDATHDQYGFRKVSRDVTLEAYEAHHEEYCVIQTRRASKWEKLLSDSGLPTSNPTSFPKRSATVQRFVRKGIPAAWRGNAWFFYAGGPELVAKHPDLYFQLLRRARTSSLSQSDREAIERDLNRTFPDNIHFKPEDPITPSFETPLVNSLRRVLRAFAIHHPRIGYCQSLNFIAGLLLLFLPEEKAFWMLHILTTRFLPGTHELSLEGANVDLWVLMLALRDAVPAVWAKVGGEVQTNTARLPPISLCTTSWFMSAFIGTLPTESVLRVWDILFYEGSRTLFRVALAVFRLGEPAIRAVADPMEIFQLVQGLPRAMLDPGPLLALACRRGAPAQAWVDRRRAERRHWYARERRAERRRRESRDLASSRAPSENDTAATKSPLLDKEFGVPVRNLDDDGARGGESRAPLVAAGPSPRLRSITTWWSLKGPKK